MKGRSCEAPCSTRLGGLNEAVITLRRRRLGSFSLCIGEGEGEGGDGGGGGGGGMGEDDS